MSTSDRRPFVPEGFVPPSSLDHPSFRLRPLGPEHNERDHRAWMRSINHIRSTPGFPDGDWPSEMSSAANRDDLERHQRDFLQGRGFTYTVIEPEGPADTADVIGCVYIYPDRQTDADVEIQSWVVEDRAALDAPLARTVRSWLEGDDWPWSPDRIRNHPRS